MKKGFTLIELLIVVAIIGILAAVGASVIPNILTTAKINCAKQSHQQIWKSLNIRMLNCSAGNSVTYGPFPSNRQPSTRTKNCTSISPNGYQNYESADSHAFDMYLESQVAYQSCYNNSVSAFGGTTKSGHGWASGAGWSNGTCNLPDKGIELGQSVLGYQGGPALCGGYGGDNACLKTNVGDKEGEDKFLYDKIDLCTLD